MTPIVAAAVALLGEALKLFSEAGGAEKLHEWLTRQKDELAQIRSGLKCPPDEKP